MRLRRILLRNYRGVEQHEVVFPEGQDVTIVQGPNEVGKSSLAEAVDVLFECKDDSRARRVLALQPVGRDVATEIEVELQTGGYELVYRKRFHRDRITELEVLAPARQSLTGREAHDRAREILEQTVDVALWKALRIHQGMAVSQASVGQNASLSAALDHAAGGESGGAADESESLFELVTEEFLRYYTPTGRERRELSDARGRLERAEDRVTELEGRQRALEADVASCGRLSSEIERLTRNETALLADAQAARDELERLERLQGGLESARLRLEAARAEGELLREQLEARRDRRRRNDDLAAEEARLRDELDGVEQSLAAAVEAIRAADHELSRAEEKESAARRLEELARVDFEHWSDRDELEELGRRRERIERAREEAADAQALLATSRVTSEAVARIQRAHNELCVTRAVLQSKSPVLRVDALSDVVLEVGPERIRLPAGKSREDSITAPLDLAVPGVLRLSVTPGEDLAETRRKLDRARNEFMAACQEVGVEDLETALELLRQRNRAEAKLAERDRALSAELSEPWSDSIEERQAELKRRVFAYMRGRGPQVPMPVDREAARAAHREASAELDGAREGRETCAARCAALRGRGRELQSRRTELTRAIEARRAEGADLRALLQRDRSGAPDEDLERALRAAGAAFEEQRGLHERTRDELERLAPDAVRERARNSESALGVLRRELRAAETELTEARTRVELLGQEGLAESRDRAESQRLHLAAELERLEGRARAASLLFHSMRARREAARAAYVRPLRERVESLGRIVFGSDFEVEVSDDLRVASRTLGGRTLPWEALSTGAREQIGLIARIACAMLVAEDGTGVPLLIDDALGHSDPERLREMGVVLALAGRRVQVIVLTSFPDRYLHVGGARVVRLS